MPRVSVLLTCYNHLPYLKAAWEGLQAQTFGDFEILALDDGSMDGTREWLLERALEEPRLRCLFNEKNIGTYATLNVGVAEARGEFVAVLNDDDLWGPRKLELQVAAMDADSKVGLVHTNGWFIDGNGDRIADLKPLGFTFPYTPSGDLLAIEIDHNQIITSSAFVRAEAFVKCGAFDPSFYGCGDWHMWLRIARQYTFAYIDEPLTFYRVHGKNASLDSGKMDDDGTRIREWITTWQAECLAGVGDPALRKAFGHNWACLGTTYAWAGRPAEARRAYGESIRILPLRFKSYLRWLASFLPRRAFRKLN